MHRGFIKLYRKIDDHPFYKEKRVFSKYEAWLDILKDVQHKAEETEHVIGMNVIKCSQGQSIKSLRTWGDKWGWTAKKVSRFFNLLEKMNQIRQENVTVTTRITVLNYLKYNGLPHTDDTDVTHNGNTSETQVKHDCPTDKNDKNVNNENNYTAPDDAVDFYITKKKRKLTGKRLETFNLFWEAFNWKKDKASAADSWFDIPELTNSLVDDIVKAAKSEAENRQSLIDNGSTPKWAQGWLTSRRWEDEPTDQGQSCKDQNYPTYQEPEEFC